MQELQYMDRGHIVLNKISDNTSGNVKKYQQFPIHFEAVLVLSNFVGSMWCEYQCVGFCRCNYLTTSIIRPSRDSIEILWDPENRMDQVTYSGLIQKAM